MAISFLARNLTPCSTQKPLVSSNRLKIRENRRDHTKPTTGSNEEMLTLVYSLFFTPPLLPPWVTLLPNNIINNLFSQWVQASNFSNLIALQSLSVLSDPPSLFLRLDTNLHVTTSESGSDTLRSFECSNDFIEVTFSFTFGNQVSLFHSNLSCRHHERQIEPAIRSSSAIVSSNSKSPFRFNSISIGN